MPELSTSKPPAIAPFRPECPLCLRTLPAGTTNQALNDHIDLCLNREAIANATGDTGTVKKKKQGPKDTMMDWLKRR